MTHETDRKDRIIAHAQALADAWFADNAEPRPQDLGIRWHTHGSLLARFAANVTARQMRNIHIGLDVEDDPSTALQIDPSAIPVDSPDFSLVIASHLRRLVRIDARRRILADAGIAMPKNDGKPLRVGHEGPSWSHLIHPLPLSILLRTQPDRTMLQLNIPGDTPAIHIIEGDVITFDSSPFDHALALDGRVHDIDEETSLYHETGGTTCVDLDIEIPHTAASHLAGRALSDLIELPGCGHADVDAAVARLRMRHVVTGHGRTSIELEPTPLIPYAPPPNGIDVSPWMDQVRRHPVLK